MVELVTVRGQVCEIVGTEENEGCNGCRDLGIPPDGRYSNRQPYDGDRCAVECKDINRFNVLAHQCHRPNIKGTRYCEKHIPTV